MKRTGAKSAGCYATCAEFISTACVHNMTMWGDLAYYNLDVGREIGARGRMASIWEEDDSELSTH